MGSHLLCVCKSQNIQFHMLIASTYLILKREIEMDHLWQINVAQLLIIIYSGLPKDMFFPFDRIFASFNAKQNLV